MWTDRAEILREAETHSLPSCLSAFIYLIRSNSEYIRYIVCLSDLTHISSV